MDESLAARVSALQLRSDDQQQALRTLGTLVADHAVLRDNITRHEQEIGALEKDVGDLGRAIDRERLDRAKELAERDAQTVEREKASRWNTRTLIVAALTLLGVFLGLLETLLSHGGHG